jgi:hypothetical protein
MLSFRVTPRKDRDKVTQEKDVPGIVIAFGSSAAAGLHAAGVRAFVYGEQLPSSPTLPFGRWKAAS